MTVREAAIGETVLDDPPGEEWLADQDDLKGTYRRIIEAISRGDPDSLDGLMTVDVVDHNPIPNQSPGLSGFKEWIVAVRTSFPDLEGKIGDVLADGDRVAGRVTWRGTHRGVFVGVDPTDVVVSFEAFHVVRFSGGRAAEWWGTADVLGALQQMGATVTGP
ncbi:MAG: ester cyclase [Actinomycetota bacterium]|nr:ester cyclase [Actinomycetota bacterium]